MELLTSPTLLGPVDHTDQVVDHTSVPLGRENGLYYNTLIPVSTSWNITFFPPPVSGVAENTSVLMNDD